MSRLASGLWGELIDRAHLTQADSLPALLEAAAARIGAHDLQLLVIDHSQEFLVPYPPVGPWEEDVHSVDGTVPGRAFRRVQIQELDSHRGRRLWVPILDGIDRLGVLGATFTAPDELDRRRLLRLAGATAYLLVVKASVGDSLLRTARRRPMSLAAELQWTTLPPLSVATERIAMCAMLEPCYDVGGDSVDHATDGAIAHFAIFDAQGHGLRASMMAALAVGAYRNARRGQGSLLEIAAFIEEAIADQYGDEAFVTCVIATLQLDSGELVWINAGHPPPLLLRDGRVVKTLQASRSDLPLGLGLNDDLTVHTEHLQPGDQILAYTDGVIEAHDADGEQFGIARLADFVARADAAGEPIAETMRRLSRAVLAHSHGDLRDDATHMLVGWLTDQPRGMLPDELVDAGV